MKRPKVSIIMGIYNCEKYLREAIEAILDQSFTDWEFVICDDGSKDNSMAIVQAYSAKYPEKFVILKNEKNMGLNYTLNHCLEHVHGEYIARMDGDDICNPTRLEKEVRFLDEHPEYALVSTEMLMFDEKGIWGRKRVIEYPEISDFCKHSPFFCHAAVMIRKKAFFEVEGYTVDERLLRVEDCHLWFKLYGAGYKGANIPEPLYSMRDDRNATGRRNFKARLNGIYVMWVGFKLVKMPIYKYYYVLRCAVLEMVKALIPVKLYETLHHKKFE